MNEATIDMLQDMLDQCRASVHSGQRTRGRMVIRRLHEPLRVHAPELLRLARLGLRAEAAHQASDTRNVDAAQADLEIVSDILEQLPPDRVAQRAGLAARRAELIEEIADLEGKMRETMP